jgi:hypothetical protein
MKAEYADLDVVLGVCIAFEIPKAAVDTDKARFEPDASRDASGQDPNRGQWSCLAPGCGCGAPREAAYARTMTGATFNQSSHQEKHHSLHAVSHLRRSRYTLPVRVPATLHKTPVNQNEYIW